ncbi:tbc domain-containing protein [Stylonychia lemnae]|uniref:Tbc domain-containing protein n=1 Tax=Stylonychia lemnae TaxID=5949 RepID=A0A078AS09_STYLE|nr:tbc domain-containing protein [Stylonychia lemnae]|eukprot:CDW83987.1 tbc domain-containing protein [Stylonychia lemnae]
MNESPTKTERIGQDFVKISKNFSLKSKQEQYYSKKSLSEFKMNDHDDSDDEALQFNDSDGKDIKSLEPDSKLSLGWRFSNKSSDRTPSGDRPGYYMTDHIVRSNYVKIKSETQDQQGDGIEFNILNNRKIFQEKLIGISHQIQPRKARFQRKKEGYHLILKKNFSLTHDEEIEILDNLLINQRQQTLSKLERRVLKIMVKRGIPERYRRHLWLRASGASASMSLPENQSYYKNLKRLEMNYPNPSFNQIELDLRRTFYELKISKSEQLIDKLRNVLATYCKRNPTIGYCQGMNFLVGRLIKVMQSSSSRHQKNSTPIYNTDNIRASTNFIPNNSENQSNPNLLKSQTSLLSDVKTENSQGYRLSQVQNSQEVDDRDEEEAFWIFTHLVETILPLDYYSNMVGALIDQKIFYDIFKEKIPDLCNHLESVGFDPSLLAFQWLVCLLSFNLPQEVSVRVWDLFFLKGTKTIFRISLALLHLMKNELMQTTDFAEIFEILEAFPRKLIDEKTLLQTAEIRKYKIKNRVISRMRAEKREAVEKELQKLVLVKDTYKGTYQRLKFLNKFYLYNGVQRSDNANSTTHELYYKSLDQYENEVMRVFNCSTEWPICLFDFTYKNKIPNYIVMASSSESPDIIQDYFYPSANSQLQNQDQEIEFNLPIEKPSEGLLIERGRHYCERNQKFIHNFKKLYDKGDCRLFNSQNLCFDICSDINSTQNLKNYIDEIAKIDINKDINPPVPIDVQAAIVATNKQISFQNIIELDDEYQQSQSMSDKENIKDSAENEIQNMQSQKMNKIKKPRFKSTALKQLSSDMEDEHEMNENYEQLQISMNSLHMSALDIITSNLDIKQAKKNKDTLNKKYIFTNFF